jgi:hypothetical protein
MLFFFPFAVEPAAGPARTAQWPLPMLPAPRGARGPAERSEQGFANAISEAGQLTADLLKQALGSLTSSMTALGNRANAFFAQIAAALAFDRIARDTASFFGMVWPGLGATPPPLAFAGPWAAAFPNLAPYSAFGLPAAANPWALFAQAANMWTSLWLPASPPARTRPAPVMATSWVPGFDLSFMFGQRPSLFQ